MMHHGCPGTEEMLALITVIAGAAAVVWASVWASVCVGLRHESSRNDERFMEEQYRTAQPACSEALSLSLRRPAAVPMMYDVYLGHSQASGADQCKILAMLLRARGLKVWHDMDSADLTLQGMEHGVRNSRCFLVFLSDGVMSRPCCHQEMRWAKQYGCHFLGVIENDKRHGEANIVHEKISAPDDLKHLLDDIEFIANQRRDFLVAAMVEELERRSAV